jgi:NTE family protein
VKKALVVSGGGSAGSWAVGAITRLLELGHDWTILTGTSTGALIVPLVAIREMEVLYQLYTQTNTADLLKSHWWITLPWRSSLYDDTGLWRTIEQNMTPERYDKLLNCGKDVEVCTVGLTQGRKCYWAPRPDERHTFCRAMLASSNQPGFMPPVALPDGDHHMDGGIQEIAPIQRALDLGAEEVWAIVLGPEQPIVQHDKWNRMLPIMVRALDLIFHETRNNDISAVTKNSGAVVNVIRPPETIPGDSLSFDPELMLANYKNGYCYVKDTVG